MSFYEGFEKRAIDPATAALGATGAIMGGVVVPSIARLQAARAAARAARLNRMMATGAIGLLGGHTAYLLHRKKSKSLKNKP